MLSKLKVHRRAPAILTYLGAVGVVATVVTAVKATPKAMKLMERGGGNSCTKLEMVRTCWKCYIPTALVGLSTISCIFAANILNKRSQASLISAYTLLHQSYRRYRGAAKTVYGEDADSRIAAQAAKDVYISAEGYSVYSNDLSTEKDKILFYDLYSQRYFTAPLAAVLNAQYHFNRNFSLRGNNYINEFYDFLGLDKIVSGDEIGWSMESGLMWIDFENRHIELEDGLRCCVISPLWEPESL